MLTQTKLKDLKLLVLVSLLLVNNYIYFPSFEKQKSHYYIPLIKSKFIRFNLNHNLSLTRRNPYTIKLLETEIKKAFEFNFNDKSWQISTLPFAVNKFPDKYQNGVLYRIKFFIPENFKNKSFKLFILSANYIADIWLNEHWIGFHEGGFTPFAFDISDFILPGKENLLFIRLDNIPWLSDDNPNANQHNIVPYKKMDWWNYTGILRDIYIEVAPEINIHTCHILYDFKQNSTILKFYTFIENKTKSRQNPHLIINIYPALITQKNILSFYSEDLIHPERKSISSISKSIYLKNGLNKIETTLKLKNPSLWEPENPSLYIAEVILKTNNIVIEKSYFQFGIRKLYVKSQKIYLNDKPVLLKGTSYHEEFYPYGRAISEERFNLIYENLKLVKDLNCNFLRTAHYPHHPFTYYLTDRMGIAVWEEIPVMWFDGPEFLIQLKNRKIPQKMLKEMIYANYNSPSILFHGLCNECGWQDERREYLWKMKNLGKKIAPFRLYAQSAVGADMTDMTHSDMDVVGNTMYYGVFYWNDPYKDTLYAVKTVTSFFYDKPFIATEFGYWSGNDNTGLNQQVEVAQKTFKAFIDSKKTSGMVWWSLLDWFTMITGIQTMGLISMDKKFIKPVFFTLQKLYGNKIKNYKIEFVNFTNNQKINQKISLKIKVLPPKNIKSLSLACNSLDFQTLNPVSTGEYITNIDTEKLPEGSNFFLARLQLINNEVLYKKINLIVDNINEPPYININLKQGKLITKDFILKIKIKDDGKIIKAVYRIDNGNEKKLNYNANLLSARLNFKNFKSKSKHNIEIYIKDDGKNVIRTNISFIFDDTPGINIDLPYDLDRISYKTNKKDAYYWSFPAEELPESEKWVVCEGCNAKFLFPSKKDGSKNVMVCRGQYVKVKPDYYSILNIFGYSYWGNQHNKLILYYEDGTEEEEELLLSEWTGNIAQFNDHIAYTCTKHYESNGKEGKPAVSFFHQRFYLNKNKKLIGIQFPDDTHKHIISASLERR